MGKLIYSFLLLSIFNLTAQAQSSGKTYALMINGGSTKEDNHYAYYNDTTKLYKAYLAAGVKKENIISLYGSGPGSEPDTLNKMPDTLNYDPSAGRGYFNGSASLKKELGLNVSGPAKKKNIQEAFLKLSKQVKAGDNINMFITDHGTENNEINLWGETLTVDEFRAYLDLIPKTVTIQIATNICYGGKLVELTSSNTCVVSAVGDKNPAGGNFNNTPFVDAYAAKMSTGTFAETFEHAKFNDVPVGRFYGKIYNLGATNSMNYFLGKTKKSVSNGKCDYSDSNVKNINLIEDSALKITASEKKTDLVEQLTQAEYLHRIYKKSLNEYTKNKYYEKELAGYIKKRDAAYLQVKNNASLSAEERSKANLNIDKDFMIDQRKLVLNDGVYRKKENDQFKKIAALKKEIEFLESTDKEQFKKYSQIKSCMDRKL